MEKDRGAGSGEKPEGERVLDQKGLWCHVPCEPRYPASPGLRADLREVVVVSDGVYTPL